MPPWAETEQGRGWRQRWARGRWGRWRRRVQAKQRWWGWRPRWHRRLRWRRRLGGKRRRRRYLPGSRQPLISLVGGHRSGGQQSGGWSRRDRRSRRNFRDPRQRRQRGPRHRRRYPGEMADSGAEVAVRWAAQESANMLTEVGRRFRRERIRRGDFCGGQDEPEPGHNQWQRCPRRYGRPRRQGRSRQSGWQWR